MKEIMDFISMVCPITGDSFTDTIIFSIITTLSFFAAWKLTGAFADTTGLYNSGSMSLVHWLIRIIIFMFLLGIIMGIIRLVRWVASWQWWGYLILGISVSIVVFGSITIHIVHKKRKNNESIKDEEE